MIQGLEDILKADSARSTKIDCTETVSEYINKEDWRIKANSNTGYSHAGLISNISGKVIANFWLDKVYSKAEGDAHRNGDYHIHDLDQLAPYCAGHDLARLLSEGFNGVRGRVSSKPPKHFREALYQMANFIGILQAEWAGAQAFSSFDTYLAPYVFFDKTVDKINDEGIKKALLNFIFNLNVPARWGQCVPETYKCLKTDGTWVNYKNLKVGDEIYVLDIKGVKLKKDKITHINLFDAPEKVHQYSTKSGSFTFEVTTNHRVIYKNSHNGLSINESTELFRRNSIIDIPIVSDVKQFERTGKYCCTSCHIKEVKPTYKKVWCPTTNTGTFICMNDKGQIFLTGNSPFSNITIDMVPPNDMLDQYPLRNDNNYFVTIINEAYEKSEPYGDFVLNKLYYAAMDRLNQRLTIENVSKEQKIEKISELTYRHFKPEMKLIDKLFYTCLNEGDLNGQPFTFPIPTINITEDFPWDDKSYNFIFENAAKYGSSYFQNFIGSQYKRDENGNLVKDPDAYKPSDIRSMCPLTGDTQIFVNTKFGTAVCRMDKLDSKKHQVYYKGKWYNFNRIDIEDQDVYKITLSNSMYVKMGENHLQPTMSNGTISAKSLTTEDWLPFDKDIINQYNHIGPNEEIESDLCKVVDNVAYYQITKIEKIEKEKLYCIEVDNDEHLFTLGNGIITHNCRLQLDKRLLRKKGGGLFGADAQTGSISVITFNAARLGYLYKGDEKKLYKALDRLLNLAKSCHLKKRKFVHEMNERGLYPYTHRYVRTFDTFFSTIGINGMNEMIRNFTEDKEDITSEWGIKFAENILNHIRDIILQWQEETGVLFNLEASPAEGCLTFATQVLTKDGPQMIGSLCDKEVELLSYNKDTKQKEYKKAKVFLDSRTTTLYQLCFENGIDFRCTSEHPFAVVDKETGETYWAPASSLKLQDIIKGFSINKDGKEIDKEYRLILLRKEEYNEKYHVPVYNATVEDNQNFYIGTEETGYVLTHNTTYRFAREDIKRFGSKFNSETGIIHAGTVEKPYYTNSSQVPVNFSDDAFKVLDLQDNLQTLYTGGTVQHLYMTEAISDAETCKKLVKTVLSNYRLPYISITPTYSICPNGHGYISGAYKYCPQCDAELVQKYHKFDCSCKD